MIKKIILFICIVLPLSSYCQLWKTLSYGIVAGPDNCYRVLHSPSGNYTQSCINFLDSVQKPGNGFHAGFNLMKPLNKKICIEAGLLFQKENYGIAKDQFVVDPEFTDNVQCDARRFVNTTNYLSLPIGIRFYLNGNKISVYFAGGLAPSYIFTRIDKVYYYNNDKIILKHFSYYTSEINRFNIAGYGGVGASFFIINNTRIDFAPYYQRMLFPLQFNDQSFAQENIYKFGINIGLSINL
jgi:hypothetical protein